MNHYEDKDNKSLQPGEESMQHSRRRKREEEKKSKRPSRREKFEAKSSTQNAAAAGSSAAGSSAGGSSGGKTPKKKKKYRLNWKRILLLCFCFCLLCGVAAVGWIASIIKDTPDIDTSDINAMLSQSSALYDDQGEIIDTVVGSDGAKRTIVELNEIPANMQNAFIALEDKTFRDHNGFNIVRIFGAIKDAVFSGGGISGTSTLTQQLARNVYLTDTMTERSLDRKIKEAYYTVILEERLNKDQILEAYLNTVNFGQAYGVQAASQVYFNKDVSELTLAECAALAAIPQSPTAHALVKTVSASEITDETENLIARDGDIAYVWNDTAKSRMQTCLYLMYEQEYISQAEYEEAMETEISDIVNPNTEMLKTKTNYFADYVISTVIKDLQTELGYDYAQAHDLVYSGGIRIYTTMNVEMQEIIEKEMENDSNFPTLVVSNKDSKGNILDDYGNIMLYKYSNYITSKGYFRLEPSEYQWNDDGSLTIYAGKRLNLYNTTVGGQTDISVEFKNMYIEENGTFYTIAGGYINIPQVYKTKDADGNLVVSAQFFTDYPDFFKQSSERVITKGFTLNQMVIQPQSAMTIIDNETGYVKAMVGGRKINGRMILNRAVATRQSGSSIKPLTVYSAALQKSYELEQEGKTFPLVDSDFGAQGDDLWGSYLTAGSIVDDEPTTVEDEEWPVNSPKGYDGLITMRRALQKSLNICAVKIMQQTGVDYCYDLALKYGLTTLVGEGEVNDMNLAALALGGQSDGVSTLEMASAYNTFVNDGVHKSYNVYTKVTTRNGDILLETDTEETEVLDPGVAWIMRDMLQSVITEGIGSPAAVSGAKAGGKTGTTSDQFDIWFDGFTAKYSAALWIGSDINIKLSSMSGKAAALWGKIMNQIPDVASGTYSKKPSNVISVEIDTKSGMLATDASGKDTRTEYFTKGTQPTETDTVHQTANICADSKFLATPSCPDYREKSGIMRPYIPNDRVADYKNELPHYFCNLHNPDPDVYTVEEGLEVTIVQPGELDEEDDDPIFSDDPDNPTAPWDPGTEGSPSDDSNEQIPVVPSDTNQNAAQPAA